MTMLIIITVVMMTMLMLSTKKIQQHIAGTLAAQPSLKQYPYKGKFFQYTLTTVRRSFLP